MVRIAGQLKRRVHMHTDVQTFDCWRYVRGGTDRVIAKAHSHTLGVGRLRRGRSVCGCGATLKLLDALHWQFAHFSFRARHFPTHTPPPQHSHGPRPTTTHCTASLSDDAPTTTTRQGGTPLQTSGVNEGQAQQAQRGHGHTGNERK